MPSAPARKKSQVTDGAQLSAAADDNVHFFSWNPWNGKSLRHLSTQRPSTSQIIAGHIGGLYSGWANDSATGIQVDPSLYDQDFDDVSEAGSDFTDDYSRHRLDDERFGIGASHEDFDDESLSSMGSYVGEMDDDDLSHSSFSSTDSRHLVRDAWRSSCYFQEGLLSEDISESTVEEDPLFNAHGTLHLLMSAPSDECKKPPLPPTNEMTPSDPGVSQSHEPTCPEGSLGCILQMAVTKIEYGELPPTDNSDGYPRFPKILSSQGTYELTAAEASVEEKMPKRIYSFPAKERSTIDAKSAQEVDAVSKSKDEERKEAPRRSRSAKSLPTGGKSGKNKASVSVKKSTKIALEKNPIVLTSSEELQRIPIIDDKLSASDVLLDYVVDFSQILFSPIELRAALKDHSKLRRKSQKSANKKRKKKFTTPILHENGTVSETDTDLSSNVAASDSLISTKDEKKARKTKKKTKKQKIRKRGRRNEYDMTNNHESMIESQKLFGSSSHVAHRIDAIFSNKKMIFGTDLQSEHVTYGDSEQHVCKPEATKVKSKASILDETPNPVETKGKLRLVRRSVSMGGAGLTFTKSRQNRSKSRERFLLSTAHSVDGAHGKNVDRIRSKSADAAKVRKKTKKDTSTTRVPTSIRKDNSFKKGSLAKNVKSHKSKSPKLSSQPSPSSALTLGDLIDDDESVGSGLPCVPDSQLDKDMDTEMSSSASFSSQHYAFDGTVVQGPMCTAGTDLVKANIEVINKKLSIMEIQTKREIHAMRKDVDKRKRAIEERVLSRNDNTHAIDAILLLHKSRVNDIHSSSRELQKIMKSLQHKISTEISTLSMLSKQAQELQWQKRILLESIQRQELEIFSRMCELEICSRKHKDILHLSGQQRVYNSTVVGDFDHYSQESLIPLFQRWQNHFPDHRVWTEALAASYLLPETSIFRDVLNDPKHRMTFFSK